MEGSSSSSRVGEFGAGEVGEGVEPLLGFEELRDVWNMDLKLANPELEHMYRQKHSKSIYQMSQNKSFILLFLGSLAMLLILTRGFSLRDCLVHSVPFVVAPLAVVYLTHNHIELYTNCHDCLSITVQIAATFSAACGATLIVGRTDPLAVILCIRTPLTILFVIPIVCSSGFRAQMLGQLICVSVSHFWIYLFCWHESYSRELSRALVMIVWHMRSLSINMFVPVDFQADTYACVVWPGFTHFALGFVLPCALKYVVESYSKANFLVSKFEPGAHVFIWRHFWGGIKFLFCIIFFSLMIFWAMADKYLTQGTKVGS